MKLRIHIFDTSRLTGVGLSDVGVPVIETLTSRIEVLLEIRECIHDGDRFSAYEYTFCNQYTWDGVWVADTEVRLRYQL